MRHRRPPTARPALVIALGSALASTLLGGCAEMHRGVGAVGRLDPTAIPAGDAAPVARTDVKTVRPRGAPRTPASDMGLREPEAAPAAVAAAVPSPRDIFDFHPAGARPDSWRQPFTIDTSDGPLAADVRRSTAELKAFMADKRSGDARAAETDAAKTGASGKRCSETDVATAKPGCGVPRPQSAAATADH